MIRFTRSVLVVSALAIMAIPVGAETSPPIQSGRVDILGASQKMNSGVRLEDGHDRGGRGGSDNSGPGSVNSGHG